MELNIEIIKEFINLEELHSSRSNPRTYLSLYQVAVEELLKNYMKQQEEIKQQKQEIQELKENQIWSEATIEGLKTDFIHKDKIREILQIEGNADIETYLKTIVAENNRLENIEDDRDCNYVSKEKIREVIGTPYPEIAIDNLLKLLEE